jgi:hypothetical protein
LKQSKVSKSLTPRSKILSPRQSQVISTKILAYNPKDHSLKDSRNSSFIPGTRPALINNRKSDNGIATFRQFSPLKAHYHLSPKMKGS